MRRPTPSLNEQHEETTARYGFGRLAHEAAVIASCERLGAVDLRRPMERPWSRKQAGFGVAPPSAPYKIE